MMRVEHIDLAMDVTTALLWQYNNAPNITGLLEDKNAWLAENYTQFWTDWYTDVFNLQTANEFGIAVWAIILDLPLFINNTPTAPNSKWGFGQYRKNFTHGNFAKDNDKFPNLTIEEKRLILILRYYRLSCRASISNAFGISNINEFLNWAFRNFGRVYALDGLNMTMSYVFQFTPSNNLLNFLKQYDILPRPCGVGIKYVLAQRKSWGFGQYRKNFTHGNFVGHNYA